MRPARLSRDAAAASFSGDGGDPLRRAIALFIGGYLTLGIAGEVFRPGFDQTALLVALGPVPAATSRLLLLLAGLLLAAWGLRPAAGAPRRAATAAAAGFLGLAALADSVVFFRVVAAGRAHPALPVPLAAFTATALLAVLVAVLRGRGAGSGFRVVAVGGGLLVLFPLLQMQFFGRTDYSRPADAAVVFGARVYADGRPSTALADRVRTGARLWLDGRVRWLVLSGGPGDGAVPETAAMERLAVSMGVDPRAIRLDAAGVSTRATVADAGRILDALGARRVLAVSHAYHLPRVKMAFRQAGREVYTVPAAQTRRIRVMPWLVAREVAAFWAYLALAS